MARSADTARMAIFMSAAEQALLDEMITRLGEVSYTLEQIRKATLGYTEGQVLIQLLDDLAHRFAHHYRDLTLLREAGFHDAVQLKQVQPEIWETKQIMMHPASLRQVENQFGVATDVYTLYCQAIQSTGGIWHKISEFLVK